MRTASREPVREAALRVDEGLRPVVDELLLCIDEDERNRPTCEEMLAFASCPGIERSRPGVADAASGEWAKGSLIENQYRIAWMLPSGGTADACVAEDEVYGGRYVLKRIRLPELITKLAGAEFRALLDMSHESLPRVFSVKPPGTRIICGLLTSMASR